MKLDIENRLVELLIIAKVKREKSKLPSVRAATVISLLEPKPPNGPPISIPARAKKKVLIATMDMIVIMSLVNGFNRKDAMVGMLAAITSVEENTINGAMRNIQEASELIISSLCRSFQISLYG